jgi:putative ABC transport system permease protein
MNKLVFGNLVHRPLRSLISVFAIAIEVIMILSIAAIMLGMLNGTAKNQSGIGADMITHPGAASNLIGMSGASASVKVAGVIAALPHVEVAAPVYIKLTASSSVENIYGIDFKSFDALKPFVFIAGGPFTAPYDLIIDDIAAAKGFKVGDTMKVLNHDFRICGIVEHGKGGRKFIPIETMGVIDGNEGKASYFYLRTENAPQFQEDVRKEILATPGMEQYNVQTIEELLSTMTPDKMPGFNIGLRTVIGIAIIIGFLVIFQSMYTAVMERTREIGILKSMGASRLYIVGVVLRESAMIAIAGIILGVAFTYILRSILHIKSPTLAFAVTPGWVLAAICIAFTGALLGASYPAIKAAAKDPVDALAYE